MNFIRTILQSITSKAFYQGIINQDTALTNNEPSHKKSFTIGKGIWYLFRVYIIVALFLATLVSIHISEIIPKFDSATKNILPAGAEVIIKDGKLSTNTNPIVIPFPDPVEEGSSSNISAIDSFENVKNLLVLDISASTTIEAIESRGSVILLTSEGFIFKGRNYQYRPGSWSQIKDLDVTIDNAWLTEKSEWVKGFMRFVPFLAFFGALIVLFGSSLVSCLFYALIIMALTKVRGYSKSFETSYIVAIYSRTLALTIGLIAYLIPLFGNGLLSILIQVGFLTYVLHKSKHVSEKIQ